MSILGTFNKQPTEKLDYNVDFTRWFQGRDDGPLSFTAIAEPGISIDSSTLVGLAVKLVISGGTSGQRYKITVRLTTDTDLIKEADFYIRVKEV